MLRPISSYFVDKMGRVKTLAQLGYPVTIPVRPQSMQVALMVGVLNERITT